MLSFTGIHSGWNADFSIDSRSWQELSRQNSGGREWGPCQSGRRWSRFSEQRLKFAEGIAAMADGIFFLRRHLGDGSIHGRNEKDRIVAEPVVAARGFEDQAFALAPGLEQNFLRRSQTQAADKSGRSRGCGFFSEEIQDLFVVEPVDRLSIRCGGRAAAKSGADNPGRAIEGIDGQSRIVGQCPQAGLGGVSEGFLAGVFREGVAVFFHFLRPGGNP